MLFSRSFTSASIVTVLSMGGRRLLPSESELSSKDDEVFESSDRTRPLSGEEEEDEPTESPLELPLELPPLPRLPRRGIEKRARAIPAGMGVILTLGLPMRYSAASGEPNATFRRGRSSMLTPREAARPLRLELRMDLGAAPYRRWLEGGAGRGAGDDGGGVARGVATRARFHVGLLSRGRGVLMSICGVAGLLSVSKSVVPV
mmetsp:Transcript_16216/g.46731  ORF Transcript_16216/g.46731 Transcript_16216/m.46731 type:complete len:203 (-) Transcript_16216:803-1411(-)